MSNPGPGFTRAGEFASTRWSVVVAAGQETAPEAAAALTELCQAYWPPLYAFVRRRGFSVHDAQDLTQGFFVHLLESNAHGQAEPTRGKFRTFLLAMLKNFLTNEWDKQRCIKRGGGYTFQPLEQTAEEELRLHGVADSLTPERLFDRRWAETIFERVLTDLRAEYETTGHLRRFELGKQWLTGGGEMPSYAAAAAELGIEETGMRSIVHRLRRRFRELMRARIADTVSGPEEVEAEIHALFEALHD